MDYFQCYNSYSYHGAFQCERSVCLFVHSVCVCVLMCVCMHVCVCVCFFCRISCVYFNNLTCINVVFYVCHILSAAK